MQNGQNKQNRRKFAIETENQRRNENFSQFDSEKQQNGKNRRKAQKGAERGK